MHALGGVGRCWVGSGAGWGGDVASVAVLRENVDLAPTLARQDACAHPRQGMRRLAFTLRDSTPARTVFPCSLKPVLDCTGSRMLLGAIRLPWLSVSPYSSAGRHDSRAVASRRKFQDGVSVCIMCVSCATTQYLYVVCCICRTPAVCIVSLLLPWRMTMILHEAV